MSDPSLDSEPQLSVQRGGWSPLDTTLSITVENVSQMKQDLYSRISFFCRIFFPAISPKDKKRLEVIATSREQGLLKDT